MEESEFCEAKNVFVDLCVKYTEASRDEDDEGYEVNDILSSFN